MDRLEEFEEITVRVAEITAEKDQAYGSAFDRSGEIIKILFPSGIPFDQYDDMLAVTRVIDKMFRIAKDRDALGEDPWKDIMGYALLSVARNNRKKKGRP